MKKYSQVLFILFSILLINCSKSTTDDGGTNPPDIETIDKSANLLATGASASDILGNANFDDLLIEAAYVEGFRPTAEAMDAFVAFLSERTFKQNISIQYKQLDSPDEETLTLQEVDDLEKENRTAYNTGKTLAIYIYFADAPSEDDDEEEGLVTLGAVYRNTSMVIYEKTIKSLAGRSLAITTADVETATLNHEFGHLFGLVDLGTTPINDHEDPDAANHCNVEGCLMRAELQFGGLIGKNGLSNKTTNGAIASGCSLSGNSVLKMLEHKTSKSMAAVDLDAECILDLQSNGGK